jgi:hypothetical protein
MAFVKLIGIMAPDNAPILIHKQVSDRPDLELETFLCCSLDSFEAMPQNRRATVRNPDRFLGTIQTVEQYLLWGYKAILGYRIVVITANLPSQESVVKLLCDKVKDALFESILDPFYVPFSSLESGLVKGRIADLAASTQPNQP